jgi:rod shape-determining protein MreC
VSVRFGSPNYSPSRGATASRRPRFRALLPVLLLVSIGLLVLSRIGHDSIQSVRNQTDTVIAPVLEGLFKPLEPLRWAGRQVPTMLEASRELERIRDENQKLKGWEWRAKELERKLQEVTALTRTVREVAVDFVTARVVAHSSGAFARSATINAGREQSIRSGYPVLSGDGVVGRVVDASDVAARVLLLTDLNSRIPVLVGTAGTRAVLSGDNGAMPRLTYLPPDMTVAAGDDVVTSGIGGLFPRGLRIGTVVETPRGLRIKPHANLDTLEYVSVLFYQSPQLELTETKRTERSADAGGTIVVPPAKAAATVQSDPSK